MSLSFHHPQLLVLLLLGPLVWRYLAVRRPVPSTILRLAIAFLAVGIAARPRFTASDQGSDLIILADRSASCHAAAESMLRELLPLVRHQAGMGDRIAVIGFGKGTILERGFGVGSGIFLPPDDFSSASDLAEGLRMAAAIRDPGRRTAILCLSDGRYTGDNPNDMSVLAGLKGMPFWYRRPGDNSGLEVAAGEIILPAEVQPRSAWVVRYSLYASAPCRADYALSRNGAIIKHGVVDLKRGDNHYFVSDAAPDAEILEYALTVAAKGDARDENNISRALMQMGGAPRVLVVSHNRNAGLLSGILGAAFIQTDHIAPEQFPESPALLSPYRLVILENCQLSAFPGRGVTALAETVRSGLISLLVTGGPNSFGMGGYHRSALDPLLPVEMELRNDTRRNAMAVAFVLDRSGSMAVAAEAGVTKMDLANLGAAESIRLLAEEDQVSVIAVDSAPHIVIPLSKADATDSLVALTLGIQSMGGGIYCHSALTAAAGEIRKSALRSRHIILFADASDAEEQEGCIALARRLSEEGINLSVVAMGKPTDSDARFLIELAREGGGEALFSSEASGLPALFTQEIMRISRRGFLEEAAAPRLLPTLALLGIANGESAPQIGGYNVSAAREGGVVFMRLEDESQTPLLASRSLGRSSVGAILFEVDGEFSGDFPQWAATPELLVSLVRRLTPGAAPAGIKAYSYLERGVGEVMIEFSPEMARLARRVAGGMMIRWLGPGGEARESALEWLGPDVSRSRTALSRPGHYIPLVEIPEAGLLAAPAVSLPYSPEFAPQRSDDGLPLLRDLAEATGGGDGLDLTAVRHSAEAAYVPEQDIWPYLLGLALLLFLLEVAGRRLHLFE